MSFRSLTPHNLTAGFTPVNGTAMAIRDALVRAEAELSQARSAVTLQPAARAHIVANLEAVVLDLRAKHLTATAGR